MTTTYDRPRRPSWLHVPLDDGVPELITLAIESTQAAGRNVPIPDCGNRPSARMVRRRVAPLPPG